MPKYYTTHKFCIQYEFPEYRLRQWIKQHRVPGWYSGNRFMIDSEAFIEQLQKEAKRQVYMDEE